MTGRDGYDPQAAGETGSGADGPAAAPGGGVRDWASAETQAANTPPPWAVAQTQTGIPMPPPPPTPVRGPTSPPTGWPAPPSAPSAAPPPADGPTPPPTQTAPAYTLTPAPQPPATGRGAGRVVGLVALAVLVGAGTGAGAWYAVRGHSGGAEAGPAASVSVTAQTPTATRSAPAAAVTSPPVSPSDPATATGSEYASTSAVPGYRTAEDPVGYTLEVPQGWTRRQQQGEKAPVVYYDSPSDGRQLQIFALSEATPAESLDLAENAPGYGFALQPGYQVEDRTSGDTWSEVSYRYDDADKGARQVVDHRFQAADGTLYAIRASGPEDLDPALVRDPLTTALASFCPSGATGCG